MWVFLSVPLVLENLVGEVDFPSVSVSDCEIVEPQTFSLQKSWPALRWSARQR